jgi:hypothetical protein
LIQLTKHLENLLRAFFTLLYFEEDLPNMIEALIILGTFGGFIHQRKVCAHVSSYLPLIGMAQTEPVLVLVYTASADHSYPLAPW